MEAPPGPAVSSSRSQPAGEDEYLFGFIVLGACLEKPGTEMLIHSFGYDQDFVGYIRQKPGTEILVHSFGNGQDLLGFIVLGAYMKSMNSMREKGDFDVMLKVGEAFEKLLR